MIDKIVGIIGWPVSHSLSPRMQNAAFSASGLDSWVYLPLPVSKYPYIRVKEAVLGLRALGFQGANVTVPYKEAVVPYLDRLSDESRAIQAVNTIVLDSEGRLVGHNTDGAGFLRDLAEHGLEPENLSTLLLGSGGSARAIAHALLQKGCPRLSILNRTKTKADDLAISLSQHFPKAFIWSGPLLKETLKQLPYHDLIINCTSVGMGESVDLMPWDDNLSFSQSQVVYDLLYNPAKTKLLAHVEQSGAKAINGLGMLLHQGALAFSLWTGQEAPLEAMRKALGL